MGQLLRKRGSSALPLLELFCWNAINFYVVLCLLALCASDTNQSHMGCMHNALLLSMVVVLACILLPCRGHKICMFMFPGFLGKTTRITTAHQTLSLLWRGWPTRLGYGWDMCMYITWLSMDVTGWQMTPSWNVMPNCFALRCRLRSVSGTSAMAVMRTQMAMKNVWWFISGGVHAFSHHIESKKGLRFSEKIEIIRKPIR